MENHIIRKANSTDVKDILRLLIELAVYEKDPDAVKLLRKIYWKMDLQIP